MKKMELIKFVAVLGFIGIFHSAMYCQSTRKYDYKDFRSVSVGYGMHLTVTQSKDYKIELKGDDEDLRVIKVEKSGDELKVYVPRNHYRMHDEVDITITMPELTDLNLSGGSEGDVTMDVSSKSFSLNLSGGSSLKGKLTCGNTEMSLSGGSRVNLSGKGNDLSIEGSGGSIFRLRNFSSKNVDSDLSGGSQANIKMDGTLNTNQSGGSQLVYYGNVKIGNRSFSGGSFAEAGD